MWVSLHLLTHLWVKSAKTGNRPGVTIGKQWIKVGNTCELLDTPGVLYVKPVNEKSGQRLAFFRFIK